MRPIALLLFLSALFAGACHKSLSAEEQLKSDVEKIEKYLSDKGLTAQKTDSGLHYIITKEGTGGSPTVSSTIKIQYKGYLLDGTVFDATLSGQTLSFLLSELIQGWKEGIPLMKKGGKSTFFIPSGLGYGSQDKGAIPANSVLIFEITLVDYQ
ncbi:MAG: FKBP-type peptidyl-prolyl cis-trans isomerase [Bacteroidota bacterium]